MDFLTVKQFSKIWEISERRIVKLCKEDRIPGAVKNGKTWVIPENTIKPADKRNNISKYINTEKRIAIFNFNTKFGYTVISLLKQAGFLVDVITENNLDNVEIIKIDNKTNLDTLENLTNKYYDGLIFFEEEKQNCKFDKIEIIKMFSQKMNCESSIVFVNTKKNTELTFVKDLSKELKYDVGLRINAIKINIPFDKNIFVNYDEISEDIVEMITKLKNTTGMIIETDGGYLEFEQDGKTKILGNGEFYKALDTCLKSLNKNSYFWSASMMLEDEWTEEPKEMKFRVSNLDVSNRGTKVERIFIFSHSKIKEFKNNKTLKIFMQSNINTMYVDYDEILEKEPELLEIIGNGWDGIDLDTLMVDAPADQEGNVRGYLSINKREIKRAYDYYLRLKNYAKDLKEILK